MKNFIKTLFTGVMTDSTLLKYVESEYQNIAKNYGENDLLNDKTFYESWKDEMSKHIRVIAGSNTAKTQNKNIKMLLMNALEKRYQYDYSKGGYDDEARRILIGLEFGNESFEDKESAIYYISMKSLMTEFVLKKLAIRLRIINESGGWYDYYKDTYISILILYRNQKISESTGDGLDMILKSPTLEFTIDTVKHLSETIDEIKETVLNGGDYNYNKDLWK